MAKSVSLAGHGGGSKKCAERFLERKAIAKAKPKRKKSAA